MCVALNNGQRTAGQIAGRKIKMNPKTKVKFLFGCVPCRLRLTTHAADRLSQRKQNGDSILGNLKRAAHILNVIGESEALPDVNQSIIVVVNGNEYFFFTISGWNEGREFFLETYLYASKRAVFLRSEDVVFRVTEGDSKLEKGNFV